MRVVFVVGPTASGKSAYALKEAQKNSGAIVNCDSIQVYQGLKIGSALPSVEDFKKVPHFLFAYVPEGQRITAGQYRRDFFATLERIKHQFPVVYVVGGTGFYFQAIEHGMYPVRAANKIIQTMIESELQREGGPEKIHRELELADPKTAARISVNDHYRLIRAVELIRSEGKTISQIETEFEQSKEKFPYPLTKVGILTEKENLKERVQLRTEKMIEDGLIDEVRGLISRGLSEWEPFHSVGYKEVKAYLNNPTTKEQLIADIVQSTMKLIKKQKTWFARDPDVHWIKVEEAVKI